MAVPVPSVAGMEIASCGHVDGTGAVNVRAPDFPALAPLGTVRPVYEDLPKLLATAAPDDPRIAHVMATIAGYAYSDAPTVAMMATRLGLTRNRTRTISQTVDAMFIRSTAFLVQSDDGRVVVLAYRGTEPTNPLSWLVDADVDPERRPDAVPGTPETETHAGFYRNVRATRFDVLAGLRAALDGGSVLGPDDAPPAHEMEALYVTGHSLGGAMAALMTALTEFDRTAPSPPPDDTAERLVTRLRGLYTFGQPMVGTAAFARTCAEHEVLRERTFRYVYKNDVVPALPPTLSGSFGHFGREFRFSSTWRPASSPTRQANSPLDLALAPAAFVARQVGLLRHVPFPYSLQAHAPQNYIAALTPDDVNSEFSR